MTTPKFTPQQRAQGILTTFSRGDYSLAVERLRDVKGKDQERVIAIITKALSRDELDILRRYARDLF